MASEGIVYSSVFEKNFDYILQCIDDFGLEERNNNLLLFLSLFSAILDKHEAYILVDDDPYRSREIINSILGLFPEEYVLKFYESGIKNFLFHDLTGKRIVYISNFNRHSNQKLIRLISGDDRITSYRMDNHVFSIPHVSIIATVVTRSIEKVYNFSHLVPYNLISIQDLLITKIKILAY